MRTQLWIFLLSISILAQDDQISKTTGNDKNLIQGGFGYNLGDTYKHNYSYKVQDHCGGEYKAELSIDEFEVKPKGGLPGFLATYLIVTPISNQIVEIQAVMPSKTSGYLNDNNQQDIFKEIDGVIAKYLLKYPIASFVGKDADTYATVDSSNGFLTRGHWRCHGKQINIQLIYGQDPNYVEVIYSDENIKPLIEEEKTTIEEKIEASLKEKYEKKKNAEATQLIKNNLDF